MTTRSRRNAVFVSLISLLKIHRAKINPIKNTTHTTEDQKGTRVFSCLGLYYYKFIYLPGKLNRRYLRCHVVFQTSILCIHQLQMHLAVCNPG